MKPSEVIDKALTEVIPDAKHWYQGDYEDDSGEKHCMLGAIYLAGADLNGSPVYLWSVVSRAQNVCDSALSAIKALQDKIVETCDLSPRERGVLATFNDAPGRTYDEIREMLEKTRASLQEKGE